ncbi:hypothetical protein QTP70_031709, partial [Hemibagrus guttatus]
CTLNQQTVDVTGDEGQSVLLPCSCSELQAKPHTFRWRFLKGSYLEIFPADQTHRYTDRVQLINDRPLGNLSLLISHLTVEDGGWYRCEINNYISKDIRLTVKGAPTRSSSSSPDITTTSPHPSPDPLPYVPVALVTVIILHIIVAVVYCTTRKKGPSTVHYSRGDGAGTVSLQ